ncbi:MAG: cupin domain-containing protein [Gammaproteobacteria bacterium]|nr:cupin domain-containing protein [Gammaproteobacteria bacterium]
MEAEYPVLHRPADQATQWPSVPILAYKQDAAAPYKDVTRQILFDDPKLNCQLRYFEVAAGGHTTLERHQHVHAVMVVRGSGRCLVGEQVFELALHDLITVPPLTWHQFRAGAQEPLGFLCMVNSERDRPQLPSETEAAALRASAAIAAFMG